MEKLQSGHPVALAARTSFSDNKTSEIRSKPLRHDTLHAREAENALHAIYIAFRKNINSYVLLKYFGYIIKLKIFKLAYTDLCIL